MTRAEARRRAGEAVDEAAYDGPDPAEDPVLYLQDKDRSETEEKEK